MPPEMLPLIGNTFPVRSKLKELGGDFDREKRVWLIPENRIAEARKIMRESRPSAAKTMKVESEQNEGNSEPLSEDLLDAMRAQMANLQNEALHALQWDDAAEGIIRQHAAKLEAQDIDVSWADRSIKILRRKMEKVKEDRKQAGLRKQSKT